MRQEAAIKRVAARLAAFDRYMGKSLPIEISISIKNDIIFEWEFPFNQSVPGFGEKLFAFMEGQKSSYVSRDNFADMVTTGAKRRIIPFNTSFIFNEDEEIKRLGGVSDFACRPFIR